MSYNRASPLTRVISYALNPAVSGSIPNLSRDLIAYQSGPLQINCDALLPGYYVCVGK